MKRAIQIAVSVLAIIILVRPFDCFAYARTREAMDCCLKNKCAPTAKADECCQNTVPGGDHFLLTKAVDHWAPVFAASCAFVLLPVLEFSVEGWVDLRQHPPPIGSLNTRNLPLLI